MRRALIVAIVFAFVFGSVRPPCPAPIEPMPSAMQGMMAAMEHRQRREDAQTILWNFGLRAGVVRPITLAVSSACATACVDIGTSVGAVYVLIDDSTLFLDRVALEVTLAHEIGHVAAGHVAKWKTLTLSQKEACEREADAYALGMVGEARYREYLASAKVDPEQAERTIARLRSIPILLPPTTVKSLI